MKVSFEVDVPLVLMSALAGAVGLLAIVSAYPEAYTLWPRTSSDWAAWIQAFGSIGAIVAVGYIAWLERYWRKTEKDELAVVAALEMEIRLTTLQSQVSSLWTALDLTRQPHHDTVELWLERADAITLPGAEDLAKLQSVGSDYIRSAARGAASLWQAQQDLGHAYDLDIVAPELASWRLRNAQQVLAECVTALEKARHLLRTYLAKHGYHVDRSALVGAAS